MERSSSNSGVRLAKGLLANTSFNVVVLLPTFVALIYFGFLAADRYETEARFVLRSPATAWVGQLSNIVNSVPGGHGAQEDYIAHAYIRSRDAVRDISEEVGLRDVLGQPYLDPLWHYPGPIFAHTDERLYRHVQSFISLRIDNTTGISSLKVQAFRPADAERIARVLLARTEQLINRLSTRSHDDTIRAAEADVARARQASEAAHKALTELRVKHAMADPDRLYQVSQDILLELAKQSALTGAQLVDIERISPASPQITALKLRLQGLAAQSLAERRALAGADRTMSSVIAEFERLLLTREFAERALTTAVASLEATRLRAQRQRVFLELISQPSIPDRRAYPSRLLGIFAVLMICVCVYVVVLAVKEELGSHQDMGSRSPQEPMVTG